MDEAMTPVQQAERERDAKFSAYLAVRNSMLDTMAAEGSCPPELGDEIDVAQAALQAAQERLESLLGRRVTGT